MSRSQISSFIDYIPAQLHEGKVWYIDYYVKDPAKPDEFKRRQIKCNRIKSITERRRFGRRLVDEINNKLRNGWNPLLEQEAPKSFHRLSEALSTFLNTCDLALKTGELRPDTVRSYRSYITMLKEWLDMRELSKILLINFGKTQAKEFMSYVYNKGVRPSTYNNYLVNLRRIFNWLKENDYIKVSPFDEIQKKKQGHKIRIQYIDPEIRSIIATYLADNNYRLMVCCLMAFHCLIRPKEITYIKVGDIDLDNQQIIITRDVAKNKQVRYATIPDSMIKYLRDLDLHRENPNDFMFSINLRPGKERLDSRMISRYWDRLRNNLKLPKEYQFYSLRDSGIIQKIKDGIPVDEVMYQADHHSLETTNVYVRIANPKVFKEVKTKASAF